MPVIVVRQPSVLDARGRVTFDGTTNVSATLNALLAQVRDGGGGVLQLPSGTCRAQGLTLYGDVTIRGTGRWSTIIKAPDGATQTVIKTDQFDAYTGLDDDSGSPGGFGLRDLTIHGNNQNAVSGWCAQLYGSAYTIDNVEFLDGTDGGVLSEWGNTAGGFSMEAHWSNFRIHGCQGVGLDWRGPHDSMFTNGVIAGNVGDGGFLAWDGNVGGEQLTNIHVWGFDHQYGMYFTQKATLTNCQSEGAVVANLVIGHPFVSVTGGSFFGVGNGGVVPECGIQFGDDGLPVSGAQVVGVNLHGFNQAVQGHPVRWRNSAGGNRLIAQLQRAGASHVYDPAYPPNLNDQVDLFVWDDVRASVLQSQEFYLDTVIDGCESMSRDSASASTVPTTSGHVRLNYFIARRARTVAQLVSHSGGTAAGATPTLCRMGLYLLDSSNNMTLVARTASDTGLWAGTNTEYARALATAGGYPASYTLIPGQRYALASICVTGAATPTFWGALAPSSGPGTRSRPTTRVLTGQSDLPASIADSATVASAGKLWMAGVA